MIPLLNYYGYDYDHYYYGYRLQYNTYNDICHMPLLILGAICHRL